jgi:branched-chain amino acid transport system substrate-binding protein
MTLTRRGLTAGLLAAPSLARRAQASPPLIFSQAIELSGPAAGAGDAWRNGVEMAVQEINAAGGVLGQKLQMNTFDSHNGRSAVQRALEGDVVALLGPVTPDSVRMAAPLARAAGIAHIVGAEAAELAAPGGALFRTAPGPAVRMPRLAAWLGEEMKAKRISLVWSNTEFGRGDRDALAGALRARGLEVVSDQPVVPGPAGTAADVSALVRAAPDAAVVLLPEAECVRFLQAARRQALRTPLVGDTTLAAHRVLAQAGAAAEGVRCQLGFAAEAPEVAAFRSRYIDSFKEEPDAAAAKGYTAVGLLAGGVARLGRADRAALPEALRGITLAAGKAAMIMDASWDATGEMDRATFMVEVHEGRVSLLRTLTGRG